MKNLRTDIRNAIYAKDGDSDSTCHNESLKEVTEVSSDYIPHFILDQIVQYYIDKANGIGTTMRVWRPNPEVFQLVRDIGYTIAVGMGDEKTMKWLLDKIESLQIPQKIIALQTEGNRINELVNVKLRSRIKDLSVEIGDGQLEGECDFEDQQRLIKRKRLIRRRL